MIRASWGIVAACCVLVGPAQAGTLRFSWQTGQVLLYKVEQSTSAAEVVEGKKTETSSKFTSTKRWEVLNVDGLGVATVRLSLTSLRVETTTPGGETMVFDSAKPQEANSQMREQLGKYVGSSLAVLRIDTRGRVVEVKESNQGPATKFEAELPFSVVLPEEPVDPGQNWERSYRITLDPPHGTGEKFEAAQKYSCRAAQGRFVQIGISTLIKAMPESAMDQVPLVQRQPDGGVVFDAEAGRMARALLRVEKEIKNHQGEGSSYRFQSVYSEEYVGDR